MVPPPGVRVVLYSMCIGSIYRGGMLYSGSSPTVTLDLGRALFNKLCCLLVVKPNPIILKLKPCHPVVRNAPNRHEHDRSEWHVLIGKISGIVGRADNCDTS